MNQKINKAFSVFIALLVSINLYAQHYNFISYSIEDGLSQSQIRAISQDNEGYIWIGTNGGLSKFDGSHFENFSIEDGLLSNQITSTFKDSKGNLWIGCRGGVSCYDGIKFNNYLFKSTFNQENVYSIAEDSSGTLWFATSGGLVWKKDNIINYMVLPKGTKTNHIRNVFIDKYDNKWFATKTGVLIMDDQFKIKDTLKNVSATQIFIDSDESVWCSTLRNGVFHITKEKTTNYTVKDGLITNNIRSFKKRKDGSIWFASKVGISKFSANLFKNYTTKNGMKVNNIKTLMEDVNGILFIGTDGGGVMKFNNENFISYTEKDGISSSLVMSILEDKNQNIWLSTYGKGVCQMDGENFYSGSKSTDLTNNTLWCSLLAKDSSIWFGTSEGLCVLKNGTFKSYTKEQGLDAEKILSLDEDQNGNIWIGAREGLFKLNVKKDSIHYCNSISGSSINIRDIYNENDETMWFCSSGGLFKYLIKQNTVTKYDTSNGLPSNSVSNIVKDKNGRFWVGTKNGLTFYNGKDFKLVRVSNNYSARKISFLEIDNNNTLWIGTNFGLYQLNTLNKDSFVFADFIRHTNLDGIKSLECNQNSSFIDSKNNLWFGTSNGLMKHPLNKTYITSSNLPRVLLKDARLFFVKKDLYKYAKGINKITKLPDNLTLPHNKNHLTFDFVGIFHEGPSKVTYRFKLNGFDENWQPITKSQFVTYSNIPPGDFVFELAATTDLKNWTKPVQFAFTISSPFWSRWWFALIIIIVVTSIIGVIVMRRIKFEENKRATQLIIDKSKMLTLEQQALNASMNRHFIFNALNSIQYYINRQDKLSANKYLSSFAKLVRKNLDSSLVNEIYLEDELERIGLYLNLEQMRFEGKFKYKITIDDTVDCQAVKIPSMILQPFIENSIWHGILPSKREGNISIDVTIKDEDLIINIIDDGIGIEKSIANKKNKSQNHNSKGMEITKNRIELVSKISNKKCSIVGPSQIYNEKDEITGTKVFISLSLNIIK